MPTGLSSTTQPLTSTRVERRRVHRLRARPSTRPARHRSLRARLTAGRAQQRVDAGRLLERLIARKRMSAAYFRLTLAGDLGAQLLLVAVQRLDHRLRVLAAERHDEDGRELQVRAHLHLRHGHDPCPEHGILDVCRATAAPPWRGGRVRRPAACAARRRRRYDVLWTCALLRASARARLDGAGRAAERRSPRCCELAAWATPVPAVTAASPGRRGQSVRFTSSTR